jgi:hypothetical protein
VQSEVHLAKSPHISANTSITYRLMEVRLVVFRVSIVIFPCNLSSDLVLEIHLLGSMQKVNLQSNASANTLKCAI